MLSILALLERLTSAWAVLLGARGTVSQLARDRGQSRQSIYRQAQTVVAHVDGSHDRQRIAALQQQLAQVQRHCVALQQQLAQALVLRPDQLAEFAATAQAEGVSLPVTQRLLAVFLPQRTPSVAQLGRWTAAAARRAKQWLAVLDGQTRPLVREAAGDEIFFGRQPVLMVVEPHSYCWLTGQAVAQRDGPTWQAALAPYTALDYFVSDAGRALGKAVRLLRADGRPALRHGLDVFHTLREGGKALRQTYAPVARLVEEVGREQQALDKLAQQGQSRQGKAQGVAVRWLAAQRHLDRAAAVDAAWQECRRALEVFTADGQLNDRSQAQAVLDGALPRLQGAVWAKTRRLLSQPQTLGFLDYLHEQLDGLKVEAATRAAVVRLLGLQARPQALQGEGPQAAAARGLALVRTVQLARQGVEATAAVVRQVQAVLRRAWRASSLVEGINSIARMHQGRHRRMTPGLLDLKRLYWNLRRFRTGRRRRQCPYELLGLQRPAESWWQLLQRTPEQLPQQVSAQEVAA